MARHRRRRSHSGGLVGCLHGLVGLVAVVGFIIGSWHVATDPHVARADPSSAPAIIEAAPSATSPTVKPTERPTRHTTRPRVEPSIDFAQCLIDQGIDPEDVEIDTADPAEYDC